MEGCDFKTERGEEWNVKVGEQWSAVFPPSEAGGAHLHLRHLLLHLLFPLGWYIPNQFAEVEPLPTLLQTCGIPRGGRRASSSGSRPHIKMTKQRKPPPKKPRDEVKWEVGRRMRAGVEGGGNESQGSRWMVRRALSGISYRHTVNHSPHFFPVLRAVRWRNHKTSIVAFRSYLGWEFPCSAMCSLSFMTPRPRGTS